MQYDWGLSRPSFMSNQDMIDIARSIDALVELQNSENGNFETTNLDEWQLHAIDEIAESQEFDCNTISIELEKDMFGDYFFEGNNGNVYFFATIVSSFLKNKDIDQPVIFTCNSDDENNEKTVVIGRHGWEAVKLHDLMTENPFLGMTKTISEVCGDKAAINMLENAISVVKSEERQMPVCK